MDQATIEQLNRESAEELGWTPAWLGLDAEDYGPDLTAAVAAFQASSLGLRDEHAEGVVGWPTFLRLHDAHELPEFTVEVPDAGPHLRSTGELLWRGNPITVAARVEQLPIQRWYWRCPAKTEVGKRLHPRRYNSARPCRHCGATMARDRRFRPRRKKHEVPTMAVWHWPVTEETRKTRYFLEAAGLSSHGEVAWDGVVHQFVDLAEECYHATAANRYSVGWDVSLSPKRGAAIKERQAYLADELGRPERPVVAGYSIEGWKPGRFLFYYDAQLVTVAALRAALHVHLGVPLESPRDRGAKTFAAELQQSQLAAARGNFNHSDVQGGKWDACLSDETPVPSAGVTLLELAREMVAQGW